MDSPSQQPFPYKIEEGSQNSREKYPFIFTDSYNIVFVGPKKYCLPSSFKKVVSKIYNFEARPDDVWIFGVPRSGTTLTSEIVWLLGNNLDYAEAADTILDLRFPILRPEVYDNEDYVRIKEQLSTCSEKLLKIFEELSIPTWEKLRLIKGKRFIKTHIPLSLAPFNLWSSNCKVIYVARNPKDVCVSNYFWMNSYTSTTTLEFSFDEFWSYYRDAFYPFTPFFEHVKEGWQKRNEKNVLFLFYEDYQKDMRAMIRILAKFLEKEVSEDDVATLMEHVKIDNFRKNSSVNNDHLKKMGILKNKDDIFIRAGSGAKGHELFKGRIADEAQEWIQENLQDTDLKFLE